jgi:hypothetical protein
VVQHAFDLLVARVVPEPFVVKVCLVYLNRGTLVTKHILLESQEAQIPGVTLLVGYEPGDRGGMLNHGSESELPDATIDVRESHEGSPVFQVLGLIRW